MRNMLGFVSKNVLRSGLDCKTLIPASSAFLCRSNARIFFSTDSSGEQEMKVEKPVKDSTFTLFYLVNSCGLTPEAARNACKLVHVKSPKKCDSVLRLLRDNGFSKANISRLVARRPSLLVADPKITLKPKFDLFTSLGAPPDAVLKMLLEYPEILHKSLDKSLVPSLEFLRSFLHTDEKVFKLINKCRGVLRFNLPEMLGPSIGLLRDEGISEDLIVAFLNNTPDVMITSAARFSKIVDRVRKMWIGPKRYEFLDAINAVSSISDNEWERKVSIFEKWGWSIADLKVAFSKQPRCMVLSEKEIEKTLKYLVNIMELDPLYPARNPNMLMLSLKYQIIPRCSLIRYLLKMGVLSKEDFDMSSALESKEETFMRAFIKKYKEVLPELLDLYAFCKRCAATGRNQPV